MSDGALRAGGAAWYSRSNSKERAPGDAIQSAKGVPNVRRFSVHREK